MPAVYLLTVAGRYVKVLLVRRELSDEGRHMAQILIEKRIVRETVRFTEQEAERVYQEALARGVSRGSIVQRAVREYLELEETGEGRSVTPRPNLRRDY